MVANTTTLPKLVSIAMSEAELPEPSLDLVEPGTFMFGVSDAVRGRRLNRFARSLRDPARRAELMANETATLSDALLTSDEIELIRTRDWTGLIRAGGHLQFVLVIAAALGDSLWDIGAHNVGCAPDVLISACPRRVTGLPSQMRSI